MGNSESQTTQLITASRNGEADRVKELIDEGISPNVRDENSQTAMMWAAYLGHIRVIQVLVANGANIEDRDAHGYSALHTATCEKRLECVRFLLQNNAEVDARTSSGETPLHRAAHYGVTEIAEILLNHGAAINAMDSKNETPLRKARTSKMRQFLIGHGADTSAISADLLAKTQNVEGRRETVEDTVNAERTRMREDVRDWLVAKCKMPEYVSPFLREGWDRLEAIAGMTEEDLDSIPVKKGHRRILLANIAELQTQLSQDNEYDKVDVLEGGQTAAAAM